MFAILWKEWRKCRGLVLAVVLAPVIAGLSPALDLRRVGDAMQFLIVLGGIAFGAQLFAAETASGTARFEERQPFSPGKLWMAKITLPLSAMALGAAAMGFALAGSSSTPLAAWLRAGRFLLLGLYSLGVGSLCGVLLDQVASALGAGFVLLVISGLGLSGLSRAARRFDVPPHVAVAVTAALIALLLMGLSRALYVGDYRE